MAKGKKRSEDHENLERWMVSYADFITLLFAFFTVMYAVSSINESRYKVVSKSVSDAFKNPASTTELVIPELEGGDTIESLVTTAFKKTFTRDYKRVQEVLSNLEKEGKVSVSIEKRGVVVGLAESVVFESGSAELLPDARVVIDEVAQVLKGMPNYIRIEGHTDNLPINTPEFPSNWELSTARALKILKILKDFHGLNPGKLSAIGYGEFRPIASNDTPEGRARNRRVEIIILNSEGALEEPGH